MIDPLILWIDLQKVGLVVDGPSHYVINKMEQLVAVELIAECSLSSSKSDLVSLGVSKNGY